MLTGALVGAQVGVGGIPKRFMDGLENSYELLNRAEKLATYIEWEHARLTYRVGGGTNQFADKSDQLEHDQPSRFRRNTTMAWQAFAVQVPRMQKCMRSCDQSLVPFKRIPL